MEEETQPLGVGFTEKERIVIEIDPETGQWDLEMNSVDLDRAYNVLSEVVRRMEDGSLLAIQSLLVISTAS